MHQLSGKNRDNRTKSQFRHLRPLLPLLSLLPNMFAEIITEPRALLMTPVLLPQLSPNNRNRKTRRHVFLNKNWPKPSISIRTKWTKQTLVTSSNPSQKDSVLPPSENLSRKSPSLYRTSNWVLARGRAGSVRSFPRGTKRQVFYWLWSRWRRRECGWCSSNSFRRSRSVSSWHTPTW